MQNPLLHLWASAPENVPLRCPDPPPGVQNADLNGFFAADSVSAAYSAVGYLSLLIVVLAVVSCYQATRTSLGPPFVKRWWIFEVGSSIACGLAALLVLYFWPTQADAASCQQYLVAFRATLPFGLILSRAVAGFVWAMLAFLIVSLILTQVAGRVPWAGGFFHNRGCPWPRFNPFME